MLFGLVLQSNLEEDICHVDQTRYLHNKLASSNKPHASFRPSGFRSLEAPAIEDEVKWSTIRQPLDDLLDQDRILQNQLERLRYLEHAIIEAEISNEIVNEFLYARTRAENFRCHFSFCLCDHLILICRAMGHSYVDDFVPSFPGLHLTLSKMADIAIPLAPEHTPEGPAVKADVLAFGDRLNNLEDHPLYKWIDSNRTAASDKLLRTVYDDISKLMGQLTDPNGLEGEATFLLWVNKVEDLKVRAS